MWPSHSVSAKLSMAVEIRVNLAPFRLRRKA
jgi:hypothetical protein